MRQRKRRNSPWKRGESVKLVKEFVHCMDEISQLYSISEQKIEYLNKLREDCETLEPPAPRKIDVGTHGIHGTYDYRRDMIDRIDGAIKLIKSNHELMPRILGDLKGSLDVVSNDLETCSQHIQLNSVHQLFQLRSIEQNELAIIAESNNKAILVFTVVTVIFLPLSFFTSYFGMNLEGIVNSNKTERYFWEVCGTVALTVVTFTFIYAWIWGHRQHSHARDDTMR